MVIKISKYIYRGILVTIGIFLVYITIIYITPNKTYPEILVEQLHPLVYDMSSVSTYEEEPSAVDAAFLHEGALYTVSNFNNQTRIVQLLEKGKMNIAFEHTFDTEPELSHYVASSGNLIYINREGIYCFDPFGTGALLWSVPHMSGATAYGFMGDTATGIWMHYKTPEAWYAQQLSYSGEFQQPKEIPFDDFYNCECNEMGVFFAYNIEKGNQKRKKIQYTDWDFNVINDFVLPPQLGMIRITNTNLFTESFLKARTRNKILQFALDKSRPEKQFDIPEREGDIAPVFVQNIFPINENLFVTADFFRTQNELIYQFNGGTLQKRYMYAHDPVQRLNSIAMIEAENNYIAVSQDYLADDQAGRLFVSYLPK